ncbi:MAG: type IV toxin-antitoxin system AbiEi family antitoxin domain-containing protein [Archangiaceae bacterium]|nr:type IV toxin-antitoxin system AbiEi family antitoxin domain-containing protein [Archangiaceae bacterium]
MARDALVLPIAHAQYGLVSRRQALAAGMSGPVIDRRIRRGEWEPVAPGVYPPLGCEPLVAPARLRRMPAERASWRAVAPLRRLRLPARRPESTGPRAHRAGRAPRAPPRHRCHRPRDPHLRARAVQGHAGHPALSHPPRPRPRAHRARARDGDGLGDALRQALSACAREAPQERAPTRPHRHSDPARAARGLRRHPRQRPRGAGAQAALRRRSAQTRGALRGLAPAPLHRQRRLRLAASEARRAGTRPQVPLEPLSLSHRSAPADPDARCRLAAGRDHLGRGARTPRRAHRLRARHLGALRA